MMDNAAHNASYDQQLTDSMREILNDIAAYLLKEETSIIVVENSAGEYQWFIESLSLMAKQINLCDSCITLLENGMEQEAFILARSQFNNMLWIRYLMNDDAEHSHYKEFVYQPQMNQILQDKSILKLIREFSEGLDSRLTSDAAKKKLEDRITENKEMLKKAGIPEKGMKSIAQLALQNFDTYGSYVTLYNESSKFEHSNVSTTRRYRKKILSDQSNNVIFTFDLGKSDKELWFRVFQYSHTSLFYAYHAITDKIFKDERQLLEVNPITKSAPYNEEALKRIMYKIGSVLDICEKDMEEFDKHYLDQMPE